MLFFDFHIISSSLPPLPVQLISEQVKASQENWKFVLLITRWLCVAQSEKCSTQSINEKCE